MLRTLFKNWWILTLKGLLLIAFGIFCFVNPGLAVTTLALWFSLLLIIDGVLSLIVVATHWKEAEDKWLLVMEGVIILLLGILLWRNPGVTLLFVAMLIAAWALLSGVGRIAMAIQLRKEIKGEFWLGLSGVLLLILGVLIIAQPDLGIATLAWTIGLLTLLVGIVMVFFSLKVRKGGRFLKDKVEEFRDKVS